jgi:hypothetical protein
VETYPEEGAAFAVATSKGQNLARRNHSPGSLRFTAEHPPNTRLLNCFDCDPYEAVAADPLPRSSYFRGRSPGRNQGAREWLDPSLGIRRGELISRINRLPSRDREGADFYHRMRGAEAVLLGQPTVSKPRTECEMSIISSERFLDYLKTGGPFVNQVMINLCHGINGHLYQVVELRTSSAAERLGHFERDHVASRLTKTEMAQFLGITLSLESRTLAKARPDCAV